MPNVIYMGGFQCKPAKPLPADLEEFVQSSGEHGVILMSLGTFVTEIPADLTNMIASTFAKLPQKVIWKHKGDKPAALGNNTLLVDWMPQNDLLGHPKIKLFVAHGGTNGVQEAMYHGVPVVGLPLFFDQYDNLLRLKDRGGAEILSIQTVDKDDNFLKAIQTVLSEPSYTMNMQRLSSLHRDKPIEPLDNALFWIELAVVLTLNSPTSTYVRHYHSMFALGVQMHFAASTKNKMPSQWIWITLCGLCPVMVFGGKVLVFPVDGSHWINMNIIVEELHSRGHQVSVVRPSDSWYIKETSPYYTSVNLEMGSGFGEDFVTEFVSKLLKVQREGRSVWARFKLEMEQVQVASKMHEKTTKMLELLFENKEQIQSLQDANYDLVLTDPVLPGGVILAHYLKLPFVFNVRWTSHGEGHFLIAPSPLSYVPLPGLVFSDKMSFLQRVINVIVVGLTHLHTAQNILPYYKDLIEKYLGPDADYQSLFQSADLWLMRVDFVFEFPRPTMPNVVYMGGFHCKPAKPLPEDLEEFVQSSGEHGVIIMSLGTMVKDLPSDLANAIAAAFARLPQKVIWRHKGDKPATLGNNTLLVDWMPQKDLLGHPKTKLFVAHGGTNGIYEAIYHGVPLLGIPLFFDQHDNLFKIESRGAGKIIDFITMDEEILYQEIQELLNEPSYRMNMQRLSRLHRDTPMKPLDSALFWIEFIMRHKAMVFGGKVLVFPVDGSHWVNMNIIVEELHSRGHQVSVVRPSDSWYIKETSPYYTSVNLEMGSGFDEDFASDLTVKLLEVQREGRSAWAQFKLELEQMNAASMIHETTSKMLELLFENKEQIQSLQDANYDLVLTDPAIPGGVILAHYLRLPLVYNVRWTSFGEGHFSIAPSPLSYVPLPGTELSDKMSFLQRVINVVVFGLFELEKAYFIEPHYKNLFKKHFQQDIDLQSLFQSADLWLMRVDFVFEFPRPTMPNVIYMGGFHCKPAKPLPEDLEEFVQSSGEHGVILMSLGTIFGELPPDLANAIAGAFARLPQKVIWRHKGDKPATLGNNTLLVDWMPQKDLLGHPKTKLFVAHGGTNGVQEAIYHGVPILGLPLVFDQRDNLFKIETREAGKILDIFTMDEEIFYEGIQEVLNEPSYRMNMQRLSRLHRDTPMKPLDSALFWIEFIMRHKGAAHLRTESYKLPWYSYHSVDVVLFLTGALLLLLLTSFMLMNCFFSKLCKRKAKRE
ncbi:hypothetical protein INR49_020248%2C partial [Xyrichtys novacula]|uniref:UDP-glycosyltransferases domain-containing protein n=1 Tax=Xyrichtys novacula TaxID=13765 RepID=A0AAV1EK12_XYRNO|nr:hypothetical protein INR49_020248%2C partial [Xyrichtys novacula]